MRMLSSAHGNGFTVASNSIAISTEGVLFNFVRKLVNGGCVRQ